MESAPFREPIMDKAGVMAASWMQWLQKIGLYAGAGAESGTTANRPTSSLYIGRQYFDTTLGYPIWVQSLSPTVWCDSTGAPV